jgi:glutamyl/glutaminyl-tRNA synthetase
MSREELVRAFDLDGVGRSGAIFELEKLDWLNGQYLNELNAESIVPLVKPRLVAAGLWRESFDSAENGLLNGTIDLLKTRARTLDDFVERARPYLDLSDEFEYDPRAAKKQLRGDALADQLARLEARFSAVEAWLAEPLERALRAVADDLGVSAGKLIHPTRLAVTGQAVSPGIFEVLEVIGRERSMKRLRRLIDHVGGPTEP